MKHSADIILIAINEMHPIFFTYLGFIFLSECLSEINLKACYKTLIVSFDKLLILVKSSLKFPF